MRRLLTSASTTLRIDPATSAVIVAIFVASSGLLSLGAYAWSEGELKRTYDGTSRDFEKHSVIQHRKGEYVRGPISTNTIENYFSILKRGLKGVYQHVGARHLKRYVGEFDFRYNNREVSDIERTDVALRGIEGKRLLYREPTSKGTS